MAKRAKRRVEAVTNQDVLMAIRIPAALYERLRITARLAPDVATYAIAAIETAVEEDEEWSTPIEERAK